MMRREFKTRWHVVWSLCSHNHSGECSMSVLNWSVSVLSSSVSVLSSSVSVLSWVWVWLHLSVIWWVWQCHGLYILISSATKSRTCTLEFLPPCYHPSTLRTDQPQDTVRWEFWRGLPRIQAWDGVVAYAPRLKHQLEVGMTQSPSFAPECAPKLNWDVV